MNLQNLQFRLIFPDDSLKKNQKRLEFYQVLNAQPLIVSYVQIAIGVWL